MSELERRVEALAQKCLREIDVPSWVADEIREIARALLAEAREGEKPLRLSPLAAMDMKYDMHNDIPPAPAANTEGLRYPVELRCAELEEKLKALNVYLRHHDTCLKAMTWKNTGFDDKAPCDCGLDAALRGTGEGK